MNIYCRQEENTKKYESYTVRLRAWISIYVKIVTIFLFSHAIREVLKIYKVYLRISYRE